MSKSTIARRLLATTILAGGAFATAAPAMAQDDDEIVITGTRIKRTDLEAPSPVTSIGSEALQLTNTVNTEQFINSLPQAVPGFDSTSNNPGNGTASVNLRGLGSKRTLVLVDGHRYVTADQGGVVDLNSIPSAMVERVDIVTGGASAVYGSDAMAGVVNFILRDDFEGLEISSSYELTEQSDGGIFDINAVAGGTFADDRGNAVLSVGYTKRDDVFQGDRDFSKVANDDNGTGFDPFGSSGVPGSRFFQTHNFTGLGLGLPNVGTLDPLTGNFSGGSCAAEGLSLRDPDGSLTFEDIDLDGDFTGADTAAIGASGDEFCGGNALFDAAGDPIPWINSGANTTRYNYAPVNYLQLPQERFNAAAFVNYEIAENLDFKMRAIYTSNEVPQELAPTPFFSTVTVSTSNPNLTANALTAISGAIAYNEAVADQGIVDATEVNARALVLEAATPGTYTAAELMAFSDAIGTATTARAGISATDLPVFIGRRMLEVGPRNNTQDLNAVQLAAGLEGSWLGGLDWDVYGHFNRTSGSQIQTGNVSISAFQAAVIDGTCDIFGPNHLSDACVSQVAKTGVIVNVSEQTNLIATTRGSLFDWQLPSAENPAAFSLGLEYREEFAEFKPDSVLGPDVAGFNQALPIKGRYSASEVFGEVYVPVIEGAQLAEELTLNGAFRYSDYSTVGAVESYAYGVEWAPFDGLRFRAQQQRAVRAPNIGELFSPATNGFPGAIDPCGDTAGATTGTSALCLANGVPTGGFGTALQANSQIEGLFGGNPNLSEETSDTLTVGFVAQPSFAPGLVVTVDYWDISVEEAIGTIPIQTVLDGCYIDGVASFCSLVNRRANGSIDFVELNNQNVSFLGGEGVDLQVDYTMDVGEGTLRGNLIGGYKIADEFQALPTDPVDDCVGFFGGNDGTCGEPSPEWKHVARLDYIQGPFLVSGRWRYIGETKVDDFQTNPTPGLFVDTIDAYNYFDVTAQYDISDNVQISGGVVNVADEDPPELGDCCSEQGNTWPATYETLGRTFFVGGKLTF